MELGGQLLRIFRGSIEQKYIEQIVGIYQEIFTRQNSATDNEILYVVCLVDELIEFGS